MGFEKSRKGYFVACLAPEGALIIDANGIAAPAAATVDKNSLRFCFIII
jgi:hypothetical protein